MDQSKYFSFEISDIDETDLVIVSVYDSRTRYTVRTALPHSGKQTASIMAFAGARFSRSNLSAHELFAEIKNAGKNANEKLATIFRNYGHASVADMAQLFAYIENIPMIYEAKFFNETSVGGGQARSTRYQNFSATEVSDLSANTSESVVNQPEYEEVNEKFKQLQKYSLEKYQLYTKRIHDEYSSYFEINSDNKGEEAALKARVFDTSRYFLLNGGYVRTSLAWITSAREWSRIISIFKASSDFSLICLGEQLEVLFAPDEEEARRNGYFPEAPNLIRHTQADYTEKNNMKALIEVLDSYDMLSNVALNTSFRFHHSDCELISSTNSPSEMVFMNYILSLYPDIVPHSLLEWLSTLDSYQKRDLSEALFHGHTHHLHLGSLSRVNGFCFRITCSIGESRDLNRHRAWGRCIPMLSFYGEFPRILNAGYTLPLYLSAKEVFRGLREDFENDLLEYYHQLTMFYDCVKNLEWFDKNLLLQLLPMAHIMEMYMYGSPKEIHYLVHLRVRPGGHINYRQVVYTMGKLTAESDELLSMMFGENLTKPDPLSREEFIDRS